MSKNTLPFYIKAVEEIPVWATGYIFGDDTTGLSNDQIAMVHDFFALYEAMGQYVKSVVPLVGDDSKSRHFSAFPAFGGAGDVVDCVVWYSDHRP